MKQNMKVPTPRLYLETMTFGWTGQTSSVVDESVSLSMTQMFLDYHKESSFSDNNGNNGNNHKIHIDTARIYSGGKTENILGSVLRQLDPISCFPTNTILLSGARCIHRMNKAVCHQVMEFMKNNKIVVLQVKQNTQNLCLSSDVLFIKSFLWPLTLVAPEKSISQTIDRCDSNVHAKPRLIMILILLLFEMNKSLAAFFLVDSLS